MDSAPKATLQQVFSNFAAGAQVIDGKQFAKLCKDCGLLSKTFTTTDVDIIHAKNWDKTTKKQNFAAFKESLNQIATKKGMSGPDLEAQICSTGGPQFQGTKADYVKFHDDKSTYTGVYAKGGPTNVDVGGSGKIGDLSQLCDRTGADVRGVKK